MTPRTPLGRALTEGPDACRTVADVDGTVAVREAAGLPLSPAERQDVSEVRAMLTRGAR